MDSWRACRNLSNGSLRLESQGATGVRAGLWAEAPARVGLRAIEPAAHRGPLARHGFDLEFSGPCALVGTAHLGETCGWSLYGDDGPRMCKGEETSLEFKLINGRADKPEAIVDKILNDSSSETAVTNSQSYEDLLNLIRDNAKVITDKRD